MKRFLIVDQDRGLAEAVRRCLVAHGREVALATDGLQCLEELQATAPSVLVLDPEILWGGCEGVLNWLASEKPMSPLVVVVTESLDGSRIPDQLLPVIDYHFQRPRSWQEILPFVHRLESIADNPKAPLEDSPKEISLK